MFRCYNDNLRYPSSYCHKSFLILYLRLKINLKPPGLTAVKGLGILSETLNLRVTPSALVFIRVHYGLP